MNDPYHAVQNEIQSSLQAAETLKASYIRIRSTAKEGSEELNWARSEFKATLAALEADLEALEESVRIVEKSGGRLFGIDEREVLTRRKYVGQVRKEIEAMQKEVTGGAKLSRPIVSQPISNGDTPQEDSQAEWSREEQQMMLHQQDRTLTTISGTLHTLAQQAGLIGQEVTEHNEMLEDLEQNVDRTDNKLSGAMKRLQKFIRDTEETKSGWCIGILIVVLCLLLLAVIIL